MSAAPQEFSASGMALRTAAILFVFVIIFTGLLSAAYQWTKPAIEASAAEEKMKLVDEVLPRNEYDNDLLNDTLTLPPTPELGLDEATTLYRARKDGKPVALVFEAVAPDGYAGKVKLLLALRADGTLAGVRVTQHKETPGLGDYIEPKKDKNKAAPWIGQFAGLSLATVTDKGWRVKKDKNKTTPWIGQFAGLSLATVTDKGWRVKKDHGRFDYYAGATITPRAVIRAVHKAVKWADPQRETLFAKTGGSQ